MDVYSSLSGLPPLKDAGLEDTMPNILSPVHSTHGEDTISWPILYQEEPPAPAIDVIIPGSMPHEPPMVVNSKQAYRILIQRQKRAKRMILKHEMGLSLQDLRRDTLSRKKDLTRQKVAFKRKRENGLFVTKTRERLLHHCDDENDKDENCHVSNMPRFAHPNDMSYGSETLEPY